MSKLWQLFLAWWNNQKWVLLNWLPKVIDVTLQPMIEKEIEAKKKDIISALNSYSAHDNAVKACAWLKERLIALIPK